MKDYALTIDTAKEISMLQRTEKEKQARYFIECEKSKRTHLKCKIRNGFIDRE
jgi:anti-repressor protein